MLPTGPLRLRVYEPVSRPQPSAAVVYIHGGGFVLGSTLSYDLTVYTIAKVIHGALAAGHCLGPQMLSMNPKFFNQCP